MARSFGSIMIVACAALWWTGSAIATTQNFKSFRRAYPEAQVLSCQMRHQRRVVRQGELNLFGEALRESKMPDDAKRLSEGDFRAVEHDDADDDGATNLEEISAGTDPADPASVPE